MIEAAFETLVKHVSLLPEVQAIGRSGGRALPQSPKDGDIDVFIYCDAIPAEADRKHVLDKAGIQLDNIKIGAIGGGHWGTGDYAQLHGIDTWLMYFLADDAEIEVKSILRGEQPDKLDNYYYLTGRCAMLAGIDILFDRTGFLTAIKMRLSVYPEELAIKLAKYHLDELEDTEDLERAATRGDVLFYHFALDIALDHFLQALFAMNREFFPSRKRSMEYIDKFAKKPENCKERLLEIIRLGADSKGVGQSFEIWSNLAAELLKLNRECRSRMG